MKNGEKKYIFFLILNVQICQTPGVRRTSSYGMSDRKNRFRHPLGSYRKLGRHPNAPDYFCKILVPVISGFRLFLGCLTIVRQNSKMRARIKKIILSLFYKYVFGTRKKYFGESYCPEKKFSPLEHTAFCMTFSCVSDIAATGDTFLDVRHN